MSKIEALRAKPWYVEIGVYVGIALLLYGGFWYFVTSGTRAETREIEERVATLRQANARAQIASQRLNEFKEVYARAQVDYEDLKALLPEQRELTVILQGLQDRARGRLSVRRFTPKEDMRQEFYSSKPVEVEVTGNYNNLGAFFAQMASYQRIVSITDFKITQIKEQKKTMGKTIDGQFLLTAYYVSPEQLQPAPVAPAATKGAAAATAQPATK